MSHETEAVVLRGSGDPTSDARPPFAQLAVEPVRVTDPGPGQVAIDIAWAAICHSDLSVLTGHRPRPTPMVLGHEATGVVAAAGLGVDRWRPGDRVVLTFVPSCGHCRPCLEGRPALCEPGNAANAGGHLIGGDRPFSDAEGRPLHQHLGLSAFSRRTVVTQASLLPLPDDLPLDLGALLGCGVLTGVGAAVHTAAIEPGMEVAVFGLGGVGLSAVIGARLAGATTILGIDPDERKLPLAERVGATATTTGGPGLAEWVQENSDGGVDVAIDTSGVGAVLPVAYSTTRRGGSVVLVGLADPRQGVEISPADLVATERTIKGSYMGSTVPGRDIAWLARAYRAGSLPLEELAGERLSLEQTPAGFEALHDGAGGRQLIEISGAR